jgi:flavin reductase ActVB
MPPTELDPNDFRNAMSCFASGVTIVTTNDPGGRPVGFTASAFSSLSLNPPLVLVCLDRRAECFDAFRTAPMMAINILAEGQDEIARRFATRGADKFGSTRTTQGAATGMPLIDGALAQVECHMHEKVDGGDHVILVGEVVRAVSGNSEPLLHYNRSFGRFEASQSG